METELEKLREDNKKLREALGNAREAFTVIAHQVWEFREMGNGANITSLERRVQVAKEALTAIDKALGDKP